MSTFCTLCGSQVGETILDGKCPTCGEYYRTLKPTQPVGDSSFSLSGLGDSSNPVPPADAGTGTMPAATAPSTDEDTAKLDALLNRIAVQSHFEERYDLQTRLAEGGMGQVFRAYDRILKRQVAIKMMRPMQSANQTAIRGQFLKEAHISSRLLHPNILSVFDLGVNREGAIYYTMRLVDGSSLQACLESIHRAVDTRMISYPLRKLVEAFASVCSGVDFAHQNRVLHLDLKPANVLVSGFSEVFVIDWGLARVDDQDDSEQLADIYDDHNDHGTSLTAVFNGRAVGTPGYMAPEQARGLMDAFNESTDVYGLGGIMHYILYGTGPNRGKNAMAQVFASTETKKRLPLRSGIVPRGRRVQGEFLESIAALESIALKCLEPDQNARYTSVEALIVELSEWLASTKSLNFET